MKTVARERIRKTRKRERQEKRKRWTGLKMEGRDRVTVGDIASERNPSQGCKAHAHQLALPSQDAVEHPEKSVLGTCATQARSCGESGISSKCGKTSLSSQRSSCELFSLSRWRVNRVLLSSKEKMKKGNYFSCITAFLYVPQALLLRLPEDLHGGCNKLDSSAFFRIH